MYKTAWVFPGRFCVRKIYRVYLYFSDRKKHLRREVRLWAGRYARVRHCENSVVPGVVLADLEWGGAGADPLQKHPQPVVPYCVSTVPGVTLSEAEPPGLAGCCVRARQRGSSVAPGVVLTGRGKGRGGSPLDLFFFFDKFWL